MEDSSATQKPSHTYAHCKWQVLACITGKQEVLGRT